MKKTILIIIAVICCFSIFGCNKKTEDEFCKQEVKQISFYKLILCIPCNWEECYSDENFISFTEYDENKEIVSLFSMEKEIVDGAPKEHFKYILDDLKSRGDDVYNIEQSKSLFEDKNMWIATYNSTINKIKYYNIIVLIDCDSYLICIDFNSKDDNDSKTFEAVMDSISFAE